MVTLGTNSHLHRRHHLCPRHSRCIVDELRRPSITDDAPLVAVHYISCQAEYLRPPRQDLALQGAGCVLQRVYLP